MAAKVGGNLGRGNLKPPAPPVGPSKANPQNQPTFWQVLYSRVIAAIFVLVACLDLASGYASLPTHRSSTFYRDQDPAMYWLSLAVDVALAFVSFFYAPYHGWKFTLKFPPPPPDPPSGEDTYAGYKRPPGIIVHPKLPPLHLSDFYEPAFLRSILLLICLFGAMVTAVGIYQLAIGEVYFPNHGTLDVASPQGEPQEFVMAMIGYGVIGLLTCGLGAFLYAWRPVRQVGE